MSLSDITDFREERYVRLYRAWVIVAETNRNRKFLKGTPLSKAAFVDFLLCNPNTQQIFYESFGRTQKSLSLDDFLYQDNVEYGGLQDTKQFSYTCVVLVNAGLLSYAKDDGEILLTCSKEPIFLPDSDLSKKWIGEIKQILPLLGKSINVLHSNILSSHYGNQPLHLNSPIDSSRTIQ
jgi:hypothetical protein